MVQDTGLPSPCPRIALAGGVSSSRRTASRLLAHRLNLVGVLGLDESCATRVSGYSRLDDLAAEAGVPYHSFRNVNDGTALEVVRSWAPDLLFIVGLSQLARPELMSIPSIGCVGFHPTWLPDGRGRAPLAWLTLEAKPGAATFFLMDGGADSGPVLVQEPFYVADGDYAEDVLAKLEEAIDRALDRWLPKLARGEWRPQPQQHQMASYYGRRAPEDGLIDWQRSASQIAALVRATSRPHPGAYTYLGASKLIVWRATVAEDARFTGVVGRVLDHRPGFGWLVQAGEGLLWLGDVQLADSPLAAGNVAALRVGVKLGLAAEDEIFLLRGKVAELEQRLSRLEKLTVSSDGV